MHSTVASWKPIDMSSDVLDTVNIAADGKPDLRFLCWKKVGELDLSRGRHTVRFRFYSKPQHHGALDAFVFTTEPFLPSGTQKPGQGGRLSKASGTWPFQPERDTFRPDALFDLRGLNEKVAGQSGFVRLAADGESFVLGDGSPVRFWGVTTYVQRDRSLDDLAHHARFLAKRGVNMVRLHGHLEPKDKNSRLTDVDDKTIDEAWKLVAAMKKEGIYVTLSPYWSANVKHVPAQWGLDGWPENESPFGLLFFNPTLQAAYKSWLKALLTRPNPHTGIPLAQDPAVAIIQLQNEDSLLFWTAQNIKGKQAELLGRQFGDWLKTKYGSLAAAFKRWGNDVVPEDKPAQGVVGLLLVWEWTQKRDGRPQAAARRSAPVLRRDDVPIQPRDRTLPARRAGLQATRERRQLAHGRRSQARRRRALVVHGQRGHRRQPLLQPHSHRSRPRLADRPGRPIRRRLRPDRGLASCRSISSKWPATP